MNWWKRSTSMHTARPFYFPMNTLRGEWLKLVRFWGIMVVTRIVKLNFKKKFQWQAWERCKAVLCHPLLIKTELEKGWARSKHQLYGGRAGGVQCWHYCLCVNGPVLRPSQPFSREIISSYRAYALWQGMDIESGRGSYAWTNPIKIRFSLGHCCLKTISSFISHRTRRWSI